MDANNLTDDLTSDETVAQWRKRKREALIAARMALPQAEREKASQAIVEQIAERLKRERPARLSIYWPFRGEPDLRPLFATMQEMGGALCLPMVRETGQPLVFRDWRPGMAMRKGVWNIPEPEDGPLVQPDWLIAPVVGFDRMNFRLGYGGGYFDRTLALYGPRAHAIGVGYRHQALATIHPQRFDIAMNELVIV